MLSFLFANDGVAQVSISLLSQMAEVVQERIVTCLLLAGPTPHVLSFEHYTGAYKWRQKGTLTSGIIPGCVRIVVAEILVVGGASPYRLDNALLIRPPCAITNWHRSMVSLRGNEGGFELS